MHGHGKSDGCIVPAKLPNNAAHAVAEAVEGRRPAEGNTDRPTRTGRSAGQRVPSGLDRVREAARRDKQARFTALLHHVDLARLSAAYSGINPKAAPGVDQVTWDAYGQNLRVNLEDLLRRVHSGAYRARPSRRVYIVRRVALCRIPDTVGRNRRLFLGLMAYLNPKGERGSSMPGKQRSLKASKTMRCGARVILVKAGLLEIQSPDGEYAHPSERRLKPVPCPASAWNVGRGNLQGAGDVQRGHPRR